MASTSTGEMFTQDEVDAMSEARKQELDIVRIDPSESSMLQSMSVEERKVWLKAHKSKKPSHRQVNKSERQNRRKARATR